MKRYLLILAFCLSCWSLMAQGYRPGPVNFHDYQVTHLKNEQALPSRYDAREHGIESPVRDQKVGGPCWAFAACEAVYSLCRIRGLEVEPFSPQILTNCHEPFLFKPMTGGGNDQVAIALFSRGEGPIYESILPFNHLNHDCPAYDPADINYYALGGYYLPENDKEWIKRAILAYGAVVAGMYYDDASYDPATYFHEYTGDQGSNHGVTIIGWDDEIGAWLVKNSWGEGVHNKGYLWVSYKDVNIAKTCVTYTQMAPKEKVDHIRTYSPGGMTGAYGSSEKNLTISGIVSFEAPGKELVTYIGTYTNLPRTQVTFNIIDDGKIIYTSDPIRLSPIGFYAHKLPEPIVVSGEYKIAVDYQHDEGGFVLPTNGKIYDYVDCQLVPKKQWLQFKGYNWEPVGIKGKDFNLCIYSYTQDVEKPTAIEEQKENNIWANATSVTLLNLVGQPLVIRPVVPGSSSLAEWIQQTPLELSKGIYIVQIKDNKGNTYTEKVQL